MLSYILLLSSVLNLTFCETENCTDFANFLLSGMNQMVDPCENFYEYVCGSWSTTCPVSESRPFCNIDTEIDDRIQKILRDILEAIPNQNDSKALSLEKEWYKACTDQERIRSKRYEPVFKFVENIGGWPLLMKFSEWNMEEFHWQSVAKYYAGLTGKYSLFTIHQRLNPNNTEVKILMMDQFDGIQINWSYDDQDDHDDDDLYDYYYYDDDENDNEDEQEDEDGDRYEDYEEYDQIEEDFFINIIQNYGKSVGGNIENITHEVKEMLDFEKALHNITFQIKNAISSKEENVTTIEEFQKFYDSLEPGNSTAKIDWLEMIRALLIDSGTEINGSEKIIVFRISYFEKLVDVLKETSDRTIVNYIHWLFFRDALTYLDKEDSSWDMDIEDYMERWEYCIAHMNGLYFNTGTSQAFVEDYFSDDLEKTALEIAEEIRNQVALEISTSWIDEEAKILVKEKLQSMKFHIGYPDYYKNKTFLDHVYDGLKVGPDYFENVMNILKHDNEEFWREYREPFDKDLFVATPTMLNAFYNEADNSLTIPAAELLVPLFHSTMPVALKYGYLGFTIGHEITHGFDNEGRKYDKDGNKLSWLSEILIEKYEKNVKCFVDQFDNYGINGTLTQNENIADSAGLISAFEAYKKRMKKEGNTDKRLPGFEGFNGEQLFFVSFAASLCYTATPEVVETWLKRDEHSMEPYRVNGAVSNMKEFSRAFECSKNSPMNPINKCLLWK